MYLSRDEEPDAGRLQALLKRAELDRSAVAESVRSILGRVKEEGDNALFALEAQFDHAELSSLNVSSEELDAAERKAPVFDADSPATTSVPSMRPRSPKGRVLRWSRE